jgi:hypothetical protein
MKIGMTLPVMEPGLTRQDLEAWTRQIDEGPWSHIALEKEFFLLTQSLFQPLVQ